MNYERMYLKYCKEKGVKPSIPTQAILDLADKEIESLNVKLARVQDQLYDAENKPGHMREVL